MDLFTSAANLLLLAGSAFLASTLAAVAGFGGAAVLLPLLVLVFGVRDAIPILTVAQLIGNLSRVWFNHFGFDSPQLAAGVVPWEKKRHASLVTLLNPQSKIHNALKGTVPLPERGLSSFSPLGAGLGWAARRARLPLCAIKADTW